MLIRGQLTEFWRRGLFADAGTDGAGGAGGGANEGSSGAGEDDDGLLGAHLKSTAAGGDKGANGSEKPAAVVDDKPGADGRPAGLHEQFWDGEKKAIRTDALIKSFNDTKTTLDRLQSTTGKPPEKAEGYFAADVVKDGKLIRPEGITNTRDVPADDPALKAFADIAHKHGLTDKQFRGLVFDTMVMADKNVPKRIDPKAEREALGANAANLVGGVATWITGMATSGKIDKDQQAALVQFGRTALGVKTLLALRDAGGDKKIPGGGDPVEDALPSKDQWYSAMPDRHKEPDAYAKWQADGERIFGKGISGTSEAGRGLPPSQSGSQAAIRTRDERRAEARKGRRA